jgi:hypothetical protein
MNKEEVAWDTTSSERSSGFRRSKSVNHLAQENDHYFDEYDDIDFQLQNPQNKKAFFLPSFLAKYILLEKINKDAKQEPAGTRSKISHKLQAIKKKFKETPVVQTIDKIAFMGGIALIMATEYIFLTKPQWMPVFYATLLFPLLVFRFFMYHKLKWHYFMLDYCYYAQIVTLFSLFIFPKSPGLFKLMFCLNNGPLAVAVVAWHNSLVFHDIDKITSLYIHFSPPLVSFVVRWYPTDPSFFTATNEANSFMTWKEAIFPPLFFYILWQVFYILKTEIVDKRKLATDKKLMTSARWLAEVKPHFVYRFLLRHGWKHGGQPTLIAFQLLYTLLTLIPTKFLYEYYWLHALWLGIIFLIAVWYGASFYFDVFSFNYSKRLLNKNTDGTPDTSNSTNGRGKQEDEVTAADGRYSPNWKSLVSFVLFFVVFLCSFLISLKVIVL